MTWSSSDDAVATVSASGLVTGVTHGPATITATSENQSGTADLTVVTVAYTGVGAGTAHTCGVAADGATYCWGYNAYGQLGNGDHSGTAQASPVLIGGGISLAAVSGAGGTDTDVGGHTCGLTAAGAAYCWGYNTYGQLCLGTTTGPDACVGRATSGVWVAASGQVYMGMTSRPWRTREVSSHYKTSTV